MSPPPDRLRIWPLRRWAARLRGLAGRRPPRRAVGAWLRPCRAVHTLRMRYPLDLFFLDRENRVVKVVAGLPPRRLALCLRAVSVVELEAGVVDIEDGGISRIEAAIEHAARRDIDGNLQDVDQVPRQSQAGQQVAAVADGKEGGHPGEPVDQESPLVAPAGDAGEEKRLHQAHPMPGNQHGRMPEQRRDDDIQDREDRQRPAHRHQEGRQVLRHRRRPHAVGERVGERHEGDEARQQAEAGIAQAQDHELLEHPRLEQRLEPHRRQHGAVGVDVLASRQRHQRHHGHQGDEEQGTDGRRVGGEQDHQADGQRPGEQG
ncbi:hypothetical protein CAL29_18785 [Bordetella genomosp. 10]|uniref:DUF192 domain-containing protein n=1 Tax=Bordetella genomosp. 10 TaxID=1416804 RepID=A0A261S7D1_9BORD|nr:hypothetical protein CAL29_18785 [Bordetella genomosp. 10]